MPSRLLPLALAGLLLCNPARPGAAPAALVIDQQYQWPQGAEVRAALRQDGLFLAGRGDPQGAVLGGCLPWLTVGPLVGRGLLRLASDPLGFTASSTVFEERTGVALDASLHSSRLGVVVMPLPGVAGVFTRQGAGGMAVGSFACVSLGAGSWADALLQQSRPPARGVGDEWYLDRSPSPGGEVTHGLARLAVATGGFSLCTFAGASSASWAGTGGTAGLRVRGGLPGAEAALVACAVTPGYRSPDGNGISGRSLLGAQARLGDERTGAIEAAWSFELDHPSPAPGLSLPAHTRVTLAWSRGADAGSGIPWWLTVEGSKEVSWDARGARDEAARFSSAISLGAHNVQAGASFGLSAEGSRLGGEVTLLPFTSLRLGLHARADHLGTHFPEASLWATLALQRPHGRHELEIGLVECPLSGPLPGLAGCVRLSLSTTIHVQ